jgi:signal transduction histidine kinase
VEIARELDLIRLLELLLARLGDLVEGSAGSIHLWDDAEQCLRPNVSQKAADWRRSLRMQLGEGVSGTVAQRREGMIVNDFRESPYCTPYHREHSRHTAVLAEPLLYRDRLLGVVTVDNEPSRRRFTAADQELLCLFAVQAAVAIENARLFEALHKSYADLRKAQEDLVRSEKLAALGQMSAGIAHDLNNMLAAVLGQVELLRLRVSDPAIRESLNTLEMAATDGAQTVRRLQEFARQRSRTPLRSVCLATLVAEAVEITRPRWQDEAMRRRAVIRVDSAIPTLPPVQGHEAEIREALTNLIFCAYCPNLGGSKPSPSGDSFSRVCGKLPVWTTAMGPTPCSWSTCTSCG